MRRSNGRDLFLVNGGGICFDWDLGLISWDTRMDLCEVEHQVCSDELFGHITWLDGRVNLFMSDGLEYEEIVRLAKATGTHEVKKYIEIALLQFGFKEGCTWPLIDPGILLTLTDGSCASYNEELSVITWPVRSGASMPDQLLEWFGDWLSAVGYLAPARLYMVITKPDIPGIWWLIYKTGTPAMVEHIDRLIEAIGLGELMPTTT